MEKNHVSGGFSSKAEHVQDWLSLQACRLGQSALLSSMEASEYFEQCCLMLRSPLHRFRGSDCFYLWTSAVRSSVLTNLTLCPSSSSGHIHSAQRTRCRHSAHLSCLTGMVLRSMGTDGARHGFEDLAWVRLSGLDQFAMAVSSQSGRSSERL